MALLRKLFAVLLLPFAVVAIWVLLKIIIELGISNSSALSPFAAGLILYLLLQKLLSKPLRTYVFGHELTHAIAGILSGAKVKSFNVSSSGGCVVMDKRTPFIALAPYFVPIYTLIFAAIYLLVGLFIDTQNYYWFYAFGCGFTLAFHYALTYFALAKGQSDLKQYGKFFSITIIVFALCIATLMVLKAVFPYQIYIGNFISQNIVDIKNIGQKVYALCLTFRLMK